MPASPTTACSGLGSLAGRRETRPAPGPAWDPGAVTSSVVSVTDQPLTLGHCWVTTFSAVVFCAGVGGSSPPLPGTLGSAASSVLLIVPAEIIALISIGRVSPPRKRFWPWVE